MVPHYELRCPLHGRIQDLPANVRAADQSERCPVTRADVRCEQPLFVSEAMSDQILRRV